MSDILSARLMAKVRARIEQHLVQECTIERKTYALDEYGVSQVITTTPTTSACFLTRNTRSAAQMNDTKDQARVYYNLHLPHDADIRDGDEVVIDGERYYTEQVLRSQGMNVMRQAVLVKHGS